MELGTVSSNAESLKNAVDRLRANGGTFTQDGLNKAKDMFKNSTSDEKIIILLTDGRPTYSYKVTSAIEEEGTIYGTDFDYKSSEGRGSSEELSKSYKVNNDTFEIKDTWPATLGEARNIKNNTDIVINVLGISIDDKYSAKMELLANKGHYSPKSSSVGIKSI